MGKLRWKLTAYRHVVDSSSNITARSRYTRWTGVFNISAPPPIIIFVVAYMHLYIYKQNISAASMGIGVGVVACVSTSECLLILMVFNSNRHNRRKFSSESNAWCAVRQFFFFFFFCCSSLFQRVLLIQYELGPHMTAIVVWFVSTAAITCVIYVPNKNIIMLALSIICDCGVCRIWLAGRRSQHLCHFSVLCRDWTMGICNLKATSVIWYRFFVTCEQHNSLFIINIRKPNHSCVCFE